MNNAIFICRYLERGRQRAEVIQQKIDHKGRPYGRTRVLDSTPWHDCEVACREDAMRRVFKAYREQNGFRHPDDPERTAADEAAQGKCAVFTAYAA